MEQPSAGLMGHPGHLECLADLHVVREDQRALGGIVRAVAPDVAYPIDGVVQAVQMHRVAEVGRVDHAPVDGLALRVGEPFGERPRFPVDGRARRSVPALEHEDAIVRGGSVRVDHEGSPGQRIRHPPVSSLSIGCARPVQIRAGVAGREAHLVRRSRVHGHDVARVRRPFLQAMQGRGDGERIVHGNLDDGALGHANQRTGNLERLSLFAERIDRNGLTVLVLRVPEPPAELQSQGQNALSQFSTRHPIVVRHDGLATLRHQRVRCPSGDQADETARGNDAEACMKTGHQVPPPTAMTKVYHGRAASAPEKDRLRRMGEYLLENI